MTEEKDRIKEVLDQLWVDICDEEWKTVGDLTYIPVYMVLKIIEKHKH